MKIIDNIKNGIETVKKRWLGDVTRLIGTPYSGMPTGILPTNVPINYTPEAAVREFRGWVYGLTTMIANSASAVPLRLYTKNNKELHKRYNKNTDLNFKRPNRTTEKYLRGELRDAYGNILYPGTKAFQMSQGGFELVDDDHIVLDLLNRINPWMDKFQFIAKIVIDMIIAGNAYVMPACYSDGPLIDLPAELWPIPHPGWVRILPGDRTARVPEPYIKGYRLQHHGVWVNLGPNEIIHFKSVPDSADPYYGKSLVAAAWTSITLHNNRMKMEENWMMNSGRPDWLAFVPGGTDETLTKLEANLNAKLSNPRNTGRLLTIAADAIPEMKQLNFTAGGPFGNLYSNPGVTGRSPVIEELAAIWAVPLSKIFGNDSNRASAKTGEYSFMKDCITPYLKNIECTLNERLLPYFGIEDTCFLAFDNCIPLDKDYNLKASVSLRQAGLCSINEAREMNDLDIIDDDDRFNDPLFAVPAKSKDATVISENDTTEQEQSTRNEVE